MKKMPRLWVIVYAVLLFISGINVVGMHQNVKKIEMDAILHGTFFDIRSMDEYREGHIEGAISVPMEKILCEACLEGILKPYGKNERIIIYGNDENERKMAKEILLQEGFKNVEILNGDIADLKRKGYPIVGGEVQNDGRYFTGCISLDNYRVEEEKLPLRKSGNPPSYWDWRHATYMGITGDWTTPVKNQGSCGSCWDFAALGALESIINIRAHNPNLDMDLSEQYLLSCPSSSGGCSGWNAYWAYVYLYSSGGIIPENCFPYRANDGIPCSDKCSNWREKLLPISGYGAIRSPDRETLKEMIVNFGPVVAEMAVYSDFGRYTGGV